MTVIGTRHCAKDKQHEGLGYSFGAPHAPFLRTYVMARQVFSDMSVAPNKNSWLIDSVVCNCCPNNDSSFCSN